ncbi:Pectin acetylesterase 5 [Zea mays]|nr:Pectin acetylesterase 5 [Zea mays]
MATAPRWSHPVPPPGFAAAPRIITVALLAVSALLSRSPVPTVAAELVKLTLLANAREKGADFYNWNIVDVRYCDGGSFAGDGEGEDRNGTKLFYRGLRIWEAVVDELMAKGMDTAEQALLVGCSAGGLAALLHCDSFRARYPPEIPVKYLSDAGFFLDVDANRTDSSPPHFRLVATLHYKRARATSSSSSATLSHTCMAIAEHTPSSSSPFRQHRPTGWVTFTAATPLLALQLALLAALVMATDPSPSPELVELTLLTGAREKGAVCLDGSPPGYHLQRGFGSGSHSWIVYLQGGAWCSSNTTDTETCSERKMTAYGSSKLMGAVTFDGIFRNQQPQNPDFYNWNKVYVRGSRIWDAVVDELMGKGMDAAEQALLAGCSAGGLATLLHCDDFRARFPQEVPVKCLPDGGFFLDIKDLSGERHMRSVFSGVVQLQCFFPAELIKSISTPTFIVNSEYDSWQIANVVAPDGSYTGDAWTSCRDNIRNCSSEQMDVLHGFRAELIRELKVAEGEREWGLFVDSCFTHCQTQSSDWWHSPTSPRLGNQTVAEAVGDWYFGRRRVVKQVDCEYPCNPTCSIQ